MNLVKQWTVWMVTANKEIVKLAIVRTWKEGNEIAKRHPDKVMEVTPG